MRTGKVILVVAATLIAGLLMLGDLLGDQTGENTPPDASASTTPAADRAVSGVPEPDGEQAGKLLAALGRIDPALNHERSIGRARNTCLDLLGDDPRDDVIERTRQRFDGTAQVDTADAEAIVKLVERGGWCVKR